MKRADRSHSFTRIVDLSHPLYPGMPGWPTQPSLNYETIKIAARDGYTLTLINRMVTHTGTHIDAPAHFLSDGTTVDKMPIESLYGAGTVIDLSPLKKETEEITVQDLQDFDHEIAKGDVLVIRTGWEEKWGLGHDYLFEWPYLGVEAAKYLVSKKVKAVGIDALSVGGWNESVPEQGPLAKSSPSEVHKILLRAGVVIIEELTNLGTVLNGSRAAKAFFIFAPLNFVGAEGSPTRALALI